MTIKGTLPFPAIVYVNARTYTSLHVDNTFSFFLFLHHQIPLQTQAYNNQNTLCEMFRFVFDTLFSSYLYNPHNYQIDPIFE